MDEKGTGEKEENAASGSEDRGGKQRGDLYCPTAGPGVCDLRGDHHAADAFDHQVGIPPGHVCCDDPAGMGFLCSYQEHVDRIRSLYFLCRPVRRGHGLAGHHIGQFRDRRPSADQPGFRHGLRGK